MPAYRSAAEAEIRDAVVARLRHLRPGYRIIHEIQSACQGPNRFDLIAVGPSEIIACEIKSARDKIDRLPDQIKAMRGAAHHVIAALHEKFLTAPDWKGAPASLVTAPKEARGATVWAYPEAGADAGRTSGCAKWEEPRPAIMTCLPHGSLDMLWAAELRRLCADLGVPVPPRPTRPVMMAALRWAATGGVLTKAVCAALRRRACIEADPPIDAAPMARAEEQMRAAE